MPLKLNRYLIDLRNKAHRFERIDINGKEDTSFVGKYLLKIIFSLISIAFVYLLEDGFSENFVSFASKTLAILIGLFMTAIIFSFNKFYENSVSEEANSSEKLWDTQAYNYTKKFAYLTSYNIVLSIFVIVALSLNTLFQIPMSVNIHLFVFDYHQINRSSIWIFLKLSFIALQRFFILYWMLRVMYNTLFIVSSMVNYMTVKIDRKK